MCTEVNHRFYILSKIHKNEFLINNQEPEFGVTPSVFLKPFNAVNQTARNGKGFVKRSPL